MKLGDEDGKIKLFFPQEKEKKHLGDFLAEYDDNRDDHKYYKYVLKGHHICTLTPNHLHL